MNCPSCGRRTDILANYCSNCGVNLNSYYGLKKDRKRMGDYLPLDYICGGIAAAGVPAIIFFAATKASKLSGGAAYTSALAGIGPGGMLGGIVTLVLTAFIAFAAVYLLFYCLTAKKLEKACKEGSSREIVSARARGLLISKSARRRLLEKIRKM